GRLTVIAWLIADCSTSGATTLTWPNSAATLASALMPGLKTPSSLLTKMRIRVNSNSHTRWPLGTRAGEDRSYPFGPDPPERGRHRLTAHGALTERMRRLPGCRLPPCRHVADRERLLRLLRPHQVPRQARRSIACSRRTPCAGSS